MCPEEKTETEQTTENSKNIIEQMVDGIVGANSNKNAKKEIRSRLSGRAWEFLMFMDDDEETEL